MKRFSIIVPIYNVEKYLKACFDSLVFQRCKGAIEIIFVDDGSTDLSGKMIDEYVNSCDKKEGLDLLVIHKENGGLSSARNAGLELATGEWILFVDSDDILLDNSLEKLEKYLDKNTTVDMISFNALRINQVGEVVCKLIHKVENVEEQLNTERRYFDYLTNDFLEYKSGWEAWNRIYRRDIIHNNSLRFEDTDKVFAEDMLFNCMYLQCIRKMLVVCDILYGYRINEKSLLAVCKEESILPRLITLLDVFYDRNKNELLKNNFEKVYYHIISFQLKYGLTSLTASQILEQIDVLGMKDKKHKKWFLNCKSEFEDERIR